MMAENAGRDWTETSIAERLEHVRKHIARASNLREFWRRLTEHQDPPPSDEFSYDAVRTWHGGRDPAPEPPAAYMTRVADVFEVTIAWLVAGRGPMTVSAAVDAHVAEVEREVEDRLGEAQAIGPIPGQEVLPINDLARDGLIGTWQEIARLRGGDLGKVLKSGRTRSGQLWNDLQNALCLPLECLELPIPTQRDDAFNNYAAAVALALRQYVHATRTEGGPDGEA